MYSQNTAVINLWKVEGELQLPCCMMRLMKVLYIVEKAVFGASSGLTCICSYASDMSNLDLYAAHATSFHMVSWSGKGDTSFTMFSFCKRKSNTIRSLVLFFRMHSIGTACCTIAGTHQPALV